jgi:hypothetical protein
VFGRQMRHEDSAMRRDIGVVPQDIARYSEYQRRGVAGNLGVEIDTEAAPSRDIEQVAPVSALLLEDELVRVGSDIGEVHDELVHA